MNSIVWKRRSIGLVFVKAPLAQETLSLKPTGMGEKATAIR